jgi:hypothetical protein
VVEPVEISRRIRRRLDDSGLSADVVADLNIVVSSGGGAASAHQHAPIHQGRSNRAARAAPDAKEQP